MGLWEEGGYGAALFALFHVEHSFYFRRVRARFMVRQCSLFLKGTM